MPGPTTERLDDDFRSLRDDMQEIKVVLTRLDARLATLDDLKAEVKLNSAGITALDARVGTVDAKLATLDDLKADAKANSTGITALDSRVGTLDARLSWLIGAGKWLGSIFALAAVYGVFNIWGRLGIVENQLKNVDGRLGVVEAQLKSVDSLLGEVKGAINRRAQETATDLEERINRIARAAVDEAVKRATIPKPTP